MTSAVLRITPAWPWRRYYRAARIVERNVTHYRRSWTILVSGFFEPLFYLLSIGVGIGRLVGHVTAVNGEAIGYTSFVAPALLAASAMNGAVFDATFNVFFKLKYIKLYDAVLATPVSVGDVAIGEVAWALIRGTLYAMAFVVVMAVLGLIHSSWAVFDVPVALCIGFAFAAAGMAATSYMRSWQDFDFVQLTTLPLFLFSATFYPLAIYPSALQAVIRCSPLYQGVAALRALTWGNPGWPVLGHVAYLIVMGLIGVLIARRRLATLLLT